jgi:hypothetical protein
MSRRQVRHGIEHHGDVGHAALGATAAFGLLTNAGRVDAHVSAGRVPRVLVPRPGRWAAQGLVLVQQLRQALARRFTGSLYRRFRQPQRRHLRQQFLRGFLEALAGRPHEGHQLFCRGRQPFRRQTNRTIPGTNAAAAMAVVVRAVQSERSQNAERLERTPPLKSCRLPTGRTVYSRPVVTVFCNRSRGELLLFRHQT